MQVIKFHVTERENVTREKVWRLTTKEQGKRYLLGREGEQQSL